MAPNVSGFDEGGLRSAAAAMGTGVEEGRAQMNALIEQGRALEGTWLGEAGRNFANAVENLQGKGNALFNALEGMQNLTSSTNNSFVQTHQSTTGTVQRMQAEVDSSHATFKL
jgi:WXG100 family type VII secretion target